MQRGRPNRGHGGRQLRPRRAGLARRPRRRRTSALVEHDIRDRSRTPSVTSSTSSTPPGSPRRPTTGCTRSRRWTPTSSACVTSSTTPRRRGRGAATRPRASSSSRAARSTATRCPSDIPTPETYRGNVSCTGPRACYDESKRYGETLCVNFARQHGLPVTIARPFNNYGPGLKITDRRVIPDLARDVLAGRDIVAALRRLGDAHVLLRRRTPSSATTRSWCAGGPASPTTSAPRSRRSRWRELAERIAALARELFGYAGRVVHGRAPRPSTSSTTRSAAARDRQGARRARLRAGGRPRRGARRVRSSGTPTTAAARRRDARLDRRRRVRRPRHAARASPRSGHDVVCVDLDARRSTQINARASRRSTRPGLEELLRATRGQEASRDDRPRRRGSRLRPHADRGRHAVRRTTESTSPPSSAASRRSARRCATKDGYHVVVVKSTVVPGHDRRTSSGRLLEEASGKRAGEDFGVGVNPEFLTEGQAVADFMAPGPARARRRSTNGRMTCSRRALRSSSPTRAADAHEHADRRDDQVRVERAARDDDLVRERDRRTSARRSAASTSSTSCGASTRPLPEPGRARTARASSRRSRPSSRPGCGFGGSCLPKDVRALVAEGEQRGRADARCSAPCSRRTTRSPTRSCDSLGAALGDLARPAVTVLGLAFKPDTDDVRESPAIPIVARLARTRSRPSRSTTRSCASLPHAARRHGRDARARPRGARSRRPRLWCS